ncbi:MAG: sensor histidine kinase [Acidimicrobiales bacterium]
MIAPRPERCPPLGAGIVASGWAVRPIPSGPRLPAGGAGYCPWPRRRPSERTPIAARAGDPPASFRHEAALFDRDEDLAAIVTPFLAAGIDRDEPTIVAVGSACAEVLLDLAPDRDELIVVPNSEEMRRPAVRLQTLRRAVDVHLAAGAERVRIVSALPADGADAVSWQPWARYEAYLDVALVDCPIWQLCLVDERTAGPLALAHALRCHTHLATVRDGHQEVVHRPPPGELLDELLFVDEPATGPGPPLAQLVDPSPTSARHLARDLAAAAQLDGDDADGLVSAVSEIVTNAHLHGRGPVELCAWRAGSEVVVTVTDRGDGPSDPTVGLAPAVRQPGEGGFGLWIASQVCRSVTLHRQPDSFAVRLVACPREDP